MFCFNFLCNIKKLIILLETFYAQQNGQNVDDTFILLNPPQWQFVHSFYNF